MAPVGVGVAFDDAWNVADPTWTRLDDASANYRVAGWTIDRGRQSEIDKTSTGTARIELVDWSGAFDPTYASGTFYGKCDPMKQVAIALQNPVTSSWYTIFRGFVDRWSFQLHPTEKVLLVTIECEDALALLAAGEVVPDQHGDGVVPAESVGNVFYQQADQVADRINAVLDDFAWSAGLREVFSGNVKLRDTVVAPRSQALTVLDDACDGEFPGVANRWVSKDGKITFHGRQARFNPADASYHIAQWKAGDGAAVLADSNYVPISAVEPFAFERDKNDIINAVLSTPEGILDADIAGQWSSDSTSITNYGVRSLSFENLLTLEGYIIPGNPANDETKLFADYYVDNYATPRTRVPSVSFRTLDKADPRAPKLWDLMTRIDISDIIHLKTTHGWGGGFDEDFYVEGVHYVGAPMSDRQHEVTLTCDLSPRAFYDTIPDGLA